MKGRYNKKLTSVLMFFGASLIVLSVVGVLFFGAMKNHYDEKVSEIAEQILALTPQVTDGIVDDRVNVEMSSLEIDGENYIGIIEIPQYEIKLPVCSEWSKLDVFKLHCCYM